MLRTDVKCKGPTSVQSAPPKCPTLLGRDPRILPALGGHWKMFLGGILPPTHEQAYCHLVAKMYKGIYSTHLLHLFELNRQERGHMQ